MVVGIYLPRRKTEKCWPSDEVNMEDLAWEKVTIKALLDISLFFTVNLMKIGIESLFSEFLSQNFRLNFDSYNAI